MGDNRVDIQDLRYELRMLLGAVKISCLFGHNGKSDVLEMHF